MINADPFLCVVHDKHRSFVLSSSIRKWKPKRSHGQTENALARLNMVAVADAFETTTGHSSILKVSDQL